MTVRALVFAAAVPACVGLGAEAPAPAPTPPQKAEERYMNVLALKGIPADDLMPAMQFMSASLGVDCEYCHVDRKPESDENKKKLAAREMIELQRSINANFNGHTFVTCMTCHRGSTHPLAIPAVAGPSARVMHNPTERQVFLSMARFWAKRRDRRAGFPGRLSIGRAGQTPPPVPA